MSRYCIREQFAKEETKFITVEEDDNSEGVEEEENNQSDNNEEQMNFLYDSELYEREIYDSEEEFYGEI